MAGPRPCTHVPVAMANCLIVQHVGPEPSWAIGAALVRAGIRTDVRRTFAGDPVAPDASGYDGVVVMGGPMSACSDDLFASRQAEVALLRHALGHGLPTLGVCLGAQLLALAAGGAVYPGPDGPEVGWSGVDLLPPCDRDALFAGFPHRLRVLHWHGDTFDLPAGAQRLAHNARYPNQAFRVGEAAWGLQFHLEVTVDAVEGLLGAFPIDAAQAPGGAPAMKEATTAALADLAPWRDLAFDRFAGLVAGAAGRHGQGGSRHRFADISDS
jgi:GMP synthase-like glutamine amidotransferase